MSYGPTSPQTVSTLYFMFVRYSGDLIVYLLQDGRGGVSGSEVISCALIFRPEGRWCDAALKRCDARSFLLFGSWSDVDFCSSCLLSLYCIGSSVRS